MGHRTGTGGQCRECDAVWLHHGDALESQMVYTARRCGWLFVAARDRRLVPAVADHAPTRLSNCAGDRVRAARAVAGAGKIDRLIAHTEFTLVHPTGKTYAIHGDGMRLRRHAGNAWPRRRSNGQEPGTL